MRLADSHYFLLILTVVALATQRANILLILYSNSTNTCTT